ncbi:hypothetical protein KIN20_016315 [Parelaphostrongylus tenuis]|uniref:Uncharacterized protein n=1 Tax=Parelaphostrongylus tenuis TaxID=148309 RepID=A0AAD5QQM7_PARTN|nr:hypothetical protein KIN20_016315 [Parelaphostrongylus tenuis]
MLPLLQSYCLEVSRVIEHCLNLKFADTKNALRRETEVDDKLKKCTIGNKNNGNNFNISATILSQCQKNHLYGAMEQSYGTFCVNVKHSKMNWSCECVTIFQSMVPIVTLII